MLPTHHLVATHRGVDVFQREPGFEFTPVLLGRIASFLARPPAANATVYAFMVPMLAPDAFDDERLLTEALRTVTSAIDAAAPHAGRDCTYEWRDGAFVAVDDPRWWIGIHP